MLPKVLAWSALASALLFVVLMLTAIFARSSLGDAAATRHVEAVVSAGSAGPALAAAASTFDVAPGDTSARCGAQAWCELGQTPPLESSAPPVLAHAASAPDPAPSAPVAAFLSSPEERPPAA